MPRYSLRLRDIYDQDEVPLGRQLGQGVGQGIGNAIDSYMQERELGRDERNKMAMLGARPAGEGIHPPDRSEVQGGEPNISGVLDQAISAPDRIGREQLQAVLPGGGGGMPAAPQPALSPPTFGQGGSPMGAPMGAPSGAPSSPARRMAGPQSIGGALGQVIPPGPSITLEGRGGQRYVFDPEERARRAFQLEQEQKAIEKQTQLAADEQERQRRRGILEPRYGEPDSAIYEEFPNLNPDRFSPGSLSFEDRAALETLKGGQRSQLETQRGAQRQQLETQKAASQRELQRLRNEGQIAAVRARRAAAAGDAGAERKAVEAQIRAVSAEAKLISQYSGLDRAMLAGDPAGEAAIQQSDAELQDARQRLQDLYDRLGELGGEDGEDTDAAGARGGGAGGGVVIRGGGTAQRGAPAAGVLQQSDSALAAHDPAYAAWLRSKGYNP